MRKRGTPLPINGALNRSRTKLGLELGTWMVIVFVSITVFLVGFRLIALASFPIMVGAAWLIVRKHPRMFQLWGHSLQQKSYYDQSLRLLIEGAVVAPRSIPIVSSTRPPFRRASEMRCCDGFSWEQSAPPQEDLLIAFLRTYRSQVN